MTTNELLEVPVQYEYAKKLPMELFVPGKEFDIIFNDESELPTLIRRLYAITRSTYNKISYERQGNRLHITVYDKWERIEQLLKTIESKCPIPPMKRGTGRPNKYIHIFNKMGEGDSIIVNNTDRVGIVVYTRKNNIKITYTKLDMGNFRVWKVKDLRTDIKDEVIDNNTFIVPIEHNILVVHMKGYHVYSTQNKWSASNKIILDTLQNMNSGDSYVIVGRLKYNAQTKLLRRHNIAITTRRINNKEPYQYRIWKL